MDQQALERLRGRAAECPTNTELNQLHTEELPPEAAAKIEEHVKSCAACQERMAIRKAGFAAFPGVQPQALLAAIQRGVEEDQMARQRRRFMRRAAYVFTPLAAAAALAIVILGARPKTPDSLGPDEGVREKGSLMLRVYKFAAGRSQRVSSGDRFRAGDRLGFVADLPAAGHVNVLGIEASGGIYVAWPSSAGVSTLRSAGKLQELPGAVELDSSKGQETLYLVQCPAEVGSPATVCQASGAPDVGASPRCPSRCSLVSFILNKE